MSKKISCKDCSVLIVKNDKGYVSFFVKFSLNGKDYDLPMRINTKFMEKSTIAKLMYSLDVNCEKVEVK